MGAMGFLAAIALVLCGLLAASSLVVKKRPDACEWLDKLVPYQGWIGLFVLAWGLVGFIHSLTATAGVARAVRHGVSGTLWLWWVTYLVTSILSMGLGFLLGFGLINKMISSARSSKTATDAPSAPVGEALYIRLTTYQIPLGLAGIAVGIWSILSSLIFLPASPTFMGVFFFILMVLAGLLAAAGLVTRKMPESQGLVKTLQSFQGSIGLLTLLWSLLSLVYTLRVVGLVSKVADVPADWGGPGGGIWVWWIFQLLTSLIGIALGFLLSYGLLSKYFLAHSPEAQARGETLRKRIATVQIPLGLGGILMAILLFVFTLVWAI